MLNIYGTIYRNKYGSYHMTHMICVIKYTPINRTSPWQTREMEMDLSEESVRRVFKIPIVICDKGFNYTNEPE